MTSQILDNQGVIKFLRSVYKKGLYIENANLDLMPCGIMLTIE